jgi:hypothetical protein
LDSEFVADEPKDSNEDGDDDISSCSVPGKENLLLLDKFGVPNEIHHTPVYRAKADVWKYFHILRTPYQEYKKGGPVWYLKHSHIYVVVSEGHQSFGEENNDYMVTSTLSSKKLNPRI